MFITNPVAQVFLLEARLNKGKRQIINRLRNLVAFFAVASVMAEPPVICPTTIPGSFQAVLF